MEPFVKPKRFLDGERLSSQRRPVAHEMVSGLSDQSGPRCFGSGTYRALAMQPLATRDWKILKPWDERGLTEDTTYPLRGAFSSRHPAVRFLWFGP